MKKKIVRIEILLTYKTLHNLHILNKHFKYERDNLLK